MSDLRILFPGANIVKVETPSNNKDIPDISDADIIVGTNVSIYLDMQDVGLV